MTDLKTRLLVCPGCGSSDTRVIGGPATAGGPKYWAGCDHCHWRTWGNTEAEAIAAWNTRAAAPQPPTGSVCTCPSGDGSLRWPCPVHLRDIALAQQAEIERLREVMREAFDFWCTYCSLNEPSQDDIADEKNAMLDKMLAAMQGEDA